jgi:alpha-glucosidase (family GH31 glycosyl hydrolase)
VATIRLDVPAHEWWWGGAVADGEHSPLGRRPHQRDLATNSGALDDPSVGANQSAPLLVSSSGRHVWSERPFTFAFDGAGHLEVAGEEIVVGSGGDDLAAAFRSASRRFFPASGRSPQEQMFSSPQYNSWIELPYQPTQAGVLQYAHGLLEAGFPPGVLMIDDQWSADYGNWVFDRARFPDPAALCARLHALGFAVMVWLVPFVSPDSASSRELEQHGWLITGPDGEPVVRRWWNGFSTILDLGHPGAVGWLRDRLQALQADGVDGFKFDAGDLRDYQADDVSAGGGTAVDQCEAWARLAAEFGFNELRACWKMGGQPLAQRLHDKPPTWGRGGLASLIPEGIVQGLIGHPFSCPDMIGGGDLASFGDDAAVDQELFVRSAQCAALFPMMQFSMSPARVLDERHLAAVRAAVRVREDLLPELRRLVDHAAVTGDPILRPLAFHHLGYETVTDQFLLGEAVLCAPVLTAAATTRHVLLPPGRWRRWTSEIDEGPVELDVPVDLETIPWWRLIVG